MPNEQEIIDPLSLNLYTYCWMNPVLFYDPDGNEPKTPRHLDQQTRDIQQEMMQKYGVNAIKEISTSFLPGGIVVKPAKVVVKTVKAGAAVKTGATVATTALKFGKNDLVLGLNKNGSLAAFKAYGGKSYGEFSSTSKKFSVQIKDAMKQADTIRFNLDGVDTKKLSGQLNAFGEPINGYTNYELWLIKNSTDFLKKTVFYKNGKVVSSPF